MIVALPVPHTGTHWLREFLEEGGVEFKLRHPWPHENAWRELLEDDPVVLCTLRHPLRVASSWKRRGKDFRDLGAFWLNQWGTIDGYRTYYICLDHPMHRQWQLEKLNLEQSLRLKTTWVVSREEGVALGTNLTDDERDYVMRTHYACWAPQWGRWYG